VLLGGGQVGTSISVARSLGRAGIPVYVLEQPDSPERYSRYVRYLPLGRHDRTGEAWAAFLLGPESDWLRGAVLLACSDAGIELLLTHREALVRKYRLDLSEPAAQQRLLDKLSTYRCAAAAGVPTPRYWQVDAVEDLTAHRDDYSYPLMLKPLYSHRFRRTFGRKYFLAGDFSELLASFERVRGAGLEVVLLELIPGGDDQLCSYYTYLDEQGDSLFDFTKRVIRRYPVQEGVGCCHVTDWNPEARDLGLRLFGEAGLRGLGNVEFKRDPRDGVLKVIECNARFTAGNPLVAASGYNLAVFVYNRVVGRPQPSLKGRPYRRGLGLWQPGRDFLAFLQLRRAGELGLRSWLASVPRPSVLPYFRFDDPLPSLVVLSHLPRRLSGLVGRPEGRL